MIDAKQLKQLTEHFPDFQKIHPDILRTIQQEAYYVKLPAGHEVFYPGDDVRAIALLLSGGVRVYKMGETGREITLYRFFAGESCILTANAILNDQFFSAIAVVEEDAEAIMIPADRFREWMRAYEVWREFLYNLLSQRLSSVLELVDEVTFGRMDKRLASFLLEKATSQNPLQMTHQEIADELGSSREVISRLLGSIAHEQLIQLGRGTIEIVDEDGLRDFSLR